MKHTYFFLTIYFLLNGFSAFSQQNQNIPSQYCGTEFDAAIEQRFDENLRVMRSVGFEKDDNIWYVPLTLYLVADGNGNGRFSEVTALERFCELNQQFLSTGIQFYLSSTGINTDINNSAWYNGGSTSQTGAMPLIYKTPNTINAYIVNVASYGTPQPLCGYYYSPSDIVVMGKSCWSAGGITLMHELGHFLSLPHTFRGIEGVDYACGAQAQNSWEMVDGSNCQTAGDKICDTGPDYLSNRWNCNAQNVSNCEHIDPNGVSFYPSGTNPMSYANDACVTIFSEEQSQVMKADITARGNLQAPFTYQEIPHTADLYLPQEGSLNETYDNVYFNWVPVQGASNYVIQISRIASFNGSFIEDQAIVDINQYWSTVLDPLTLYFWRVKAFNEGYTCTGWSETGTFTTNNFTVGVREIAGLNGFSVHPNPAHSGSPIHFTLDLNESIDATLRMINIQGQTLFIENKTFASGTSFNKLEPGRLHSGMYFITLETAEGISRKKILITNN